MPGPDARDPLLTLGPFAVRPGGVLEPHADSAPTLRFRWRDRPCEARLEPGRLRLSALAGRLPSTVLAPGARDGAIAAWRHVREELPPGWALRLLPDHRLALESEAPAQVTAPSLLGAMVRFALALDPYLDRLDSAGAGTLNT